MAEWTAEELADRIFDLRLLDTRQLDSVWAEFGTRNITAEEFAHMLLRKEYMTNFQMDKVRKGDREGFHYGKYRVLYISGAGTFARVFRSVDRNTNKIVALKVLRKRFRDEPEQVELFLREARMGERLHHPNIVRVFDVSDDIKAPYMVMEFVEGQTLREFLKVRKKLDVGVALSLITDVMAGLAHARKCGITHRDMKLSNVLIASAGTAKLVDFGLATISETDDKYLTASPNARSIDYVALERGTGVRKNDHRSDIYFAGAIFYHMLTGVAPLLETRDRLLRMSVSRFQEIKPLAQLEPDVPVNVIAIVNRAMCLNPENRYQEPEEMLVDLKRTKIVLEKGGEERPSEGVDEALDGPGPTAEEAELEGFGRTVLFVESKMEMQDLFREQIKKSGYRVLITSNPRHAIQRLEDDVRLAHCAIFSTQELGGEAVAAFNRLGESETVSHLPAILLIDRHRRALIDAAHTNAHRIILSLPLKIGELRKKLKELIAVKR